MMAGRISDVDRRFLLDAAADGMTEARLGRIAVERAANAEVKQFGARMAGDHSRINLELQHLAARKGITPYAELMLKHRTEMNRLLATSGDEFDREYMSDMVQDHVKAIADFEGEVASGHDQEIRDFAGAVLPMLRAHLEEARGIAAKVGGQQG